MGGPARSDERSAAQAAALSRSRCKKIGSRGARPVRAGHRGCDAFRAGLCVSPSRDTIRARFSKAVCRIDTG